MGSNGRMIPNPIRSMNTVKKIISRLGFFMCVRVNGKRLAQCSWETAKRKPVIKIPEKWLYPGSIFAAMIRLRWFIVNISSAIFDCSAPDLDSCPDESLPEFAFIGRSNVGKSSLLNMLAGKQAMARVSSTPGFTKLINIFTMNKSWRLVDLPGYGYAQGAR